MNGELPEFQSGSAVSDGSLAEEARFKEIVGLYSELGFGHTMAPSHAILGFALKHLGRYQETLHLGEVGTTLAGQVGWRQEQGLSLELIGEIALAEGRFDVAADYLEQSVAVMQQTGQLELHGVLAVLGYAYRGLGKLNLAAKYLAEGIRSAAEVPTIFPIVTALPGVALLWLDRGEVEMAVEIYALASRYPRVAGSRWFEDIAGREIDEYAATLPDDVVAAARMRGRGRDLEETVVESLDLLDNIKS